MTTTKRSLPKGWHWKKVKEICQLGRGRVISKFDIDKNPGPYPVYSSQTQNQGAFGYLNTYDFDGEYATWTTDGANAGTVFYRNGKFNCTNVCGTLKAKDKSINMMYLSYALGLETKPHVFVASGNPKLMNHVVSEIEIPIPPLEEQNRIATYLKDQMRYIEQAQQAIEAQLSLLTHLVNSYFRESLQRKTIKMHLSDCMVEVKKGVGETWAQYPVLGATRAGVAPAKEKVGKQPQRYKLVEPGTIFYNPMRIMIGSIAMLDDGDESGITSPDYVVLKGKEGILHPRWFYYWFRSPYGENFIKSLARGAVRERMLFNRLDKGEIELPDWDTQVKIAEKLKEIKTFKQALESQLAEINELPSALLRQAFAGQL